ncbi:hypothetical protein K437DRAFT_85232 [Tilletiaria anomala UBC 951]|uniref:Secreted protein n=1 Tax=Tilletiaria anomala (strain ATCC 24038 / CBS 436.72 / UBC 951) TaxID=1037660 RepID=A0A066V3X4_TILAU|nr:uncharacterized protein K437DRAFT_85232 [Tilletiaria anomala UBC 951]KDN34938.1 hypothetical protein K437DRAFT_85232 [Tilletiaria anomala UBC 951]
MLYTWTAALQALLSCICSSQATGARRGAVNMRSLLVYERLPPHRAIPYVVLNKRAYTAVADRFLLLLPATCMGDAIRCSRFRLLAPSSHTSAE